MIWRIRKYFQHLLSLRHRKGHGIHSPYLFEFVNKVIFNGAGIAVPPEIIKAHRELQRDRTMIPVGELGAASKMGSPAGRSVASFVRHSSVSEKYGALLYRITSWFQAEEIIELGSGLGVSTLYLASAGAGVPLHSIEGNPHRAVFAESLVNSHMKGPGKGPPPFISVNQGEMAAELEKILPQLKGRYLAFVDGNHRYEPTIAYANRLIRHAGDEAVIILDDIYWSKEMFRAWKELISWPETRVSIDLYQMGIILLRSDLAKANIKIKF